MSHFYTLVLVPENTSDINNKIEELLAPYSENMNVEEYDRECYCINTEAKDAGWKAAESKFGPFDNLRKSFRDEVKSRMPSDLDTSDPNYLNIMFEIENKVNWKEHTREFNKYAEQIEQNHPKYNEPKSGCSECNGTGYYKSTYNPNSKWDWWVIGGRWNGAIQNNRKDDNSGGFNFGDEFHQLENNSISCKDLLEVVKNDSDCYPFAIVTPDGEWCENAKMGWWGLTKDDKDTDSWHETVNEILEKYSDCIAVGCDLHI